MFQATSAAELREHYAAVKKRLMGQRAIEAPKVETPKAPKAPQASDSLVEFRKRRSIELVMRTTCKYFEITMEELTSDRRFIPIVYKRHIAIYVARILTPEGAASMKIIARKFGGLDHTSVMHAINRVSRQIKTDRNMEIDVRAISELVKASSR